MADPVTLFILVAAGERADLTRAMAAATRDALGTNAVVVVREVPGEPSDSEALATESSDSANAVVELSWTDAHHQQASVRMHIAQDRRWVERSIGFLRQDADAERGRTLGFAIASILPQAPASAASEPRGGGANPGTAGSTESSGGGGSPVAARSDVGAAPPNEPAPHGGGVVTAPVPPQSSAYVPAHRLNLAVDALAIDAIASSANGAYLTGGGGSAAAQWFPIRRLSLRLGVGVLGGNLGATANTLTVFASGGIVLHPWRTSLAQPFGASLRADFLFVNEWFTHYFDLASRTQYKPAPGLGLGVDVSWLFASDVELVAGAGVDDIFVPTDVYVQDMLKATLSPLSVVAEAGLRLDF
jgi:hypothetical protein